MPKTYPCACGAQVVKLDGVLFAEHESADHYARLNRGKRKKATNRSQNGRKAAESDEMGFTGKETPEQVVAALKARDEELKRSGRVE